MQGFLMLAGEGQMEECWMKGMNADR
jgi:hypothetical protein